MHNFNKKYINKRVVKSFDLVRLRSPKQCFDIVELECERLIAIVKY